VYSKELKMNQRLQCSAEVAALSIRCIKSDKLNFNEYLDDLVMKKARTKSPAKATFLPELCNPITRQAIELSSCSNPLRIQQVL